MKKNYSAKIAIASLLLLFVACTQQQTDMHVHHETDTSLIAVIDGVNAGNANASLITPAKGMKIFNVKLNGRISADTRQRTGISSRVAGRIERMMVKYNFQPIKKGDLIMEIYSSELAAAQRDLVYVARTVRDAEAVERAKQRLQLLGMRDAEINKVLVTGEVMYRVPVFSSRSGYIYEASTASGQMESTPILLREGQYVKSGQLLFNIYQNESLVAEFAIPAHLQTKVTKGKKVLLQSQGRNNDMRAGVIGLIEPVFRNGQSFSVAKVYLTNSEFTIGEIVTANIAVVYKNGWWLPSAAVQQTGNTAMVYRKVGDRITPVEIQNGGEINGMLNSETEMKGWQVVSNAAYLADSESFVQPQNMTAE